MFAERVEQRRARIDFERVRLAVDLEDNFRWGDRRFRRAFRGCDRSESHQTRSKSDGCAGSANLFEKTTPRFGAAKNQQVVESACRIYRRQLGRVDWFGIVVVHRLKFACALPIGCANTKS